MIYLSFEGAVKKLDAQITELQNAKPSLDVAAKIRKLVDRRDAELERLYEDLDTWARVEVARHPDRPHALDFITGMADDFVELCGDRAFADDQAIVGGIGYILGRPVMIIGEEKGGTTEERLRHNFGSPKPEGYRKARRLIGLASRFGLPVVFLIDTAGAFPGAESEERGQSEAIASSIRACLDLETPSVAVVIGEGGSGGAIAIGVANSVLMLENAIYSVISPEGCASILWKSQENKTTAAEALKMTSADLLALGVIDAVIPEPAGGAHRNKIETIKRVKTLVAQELADFEKLRDPKAHRAYKFEHMRPVLA